MLKFNLIVSPRVLGRALDLDLNVHGAPNFRAPRHGDLNVFGAAQPRTQGLRAILSILRCRPNTSNPAHVVWFSTREEPIGTYDFVINIRRVPRILVAFLSPRYASPFSTSLLGIELIQLFVLLSVYLRSSICAARRV